MPVCLSGCRIRNIQKHPESKVTGLRNPHVMYVPLSMLCFCCMRRQIEPLWDVFNTGATTTTDTRPTRVYDLLPASPTYSHYVGSLTTPPCTEVLYNCTAALAFCIHLHTYNVYTVVNLQCLDDSILQSFRSLLVE